ncbi:MAG: DUF3152 domain-containing protein [Brevundimonas sp.]
MPSVAVLVAVFVVVGAALMALGPGPDHVGPQAGESVSAASGSRSAADARSSPAARVQSKAAPAARTQSTAAPTRATRRPSLPPGLSSSDVAAGLLSQDVEDSASGHLVVVPGSSAGPRTGTVRRVRVEVEDGLPVDASRFAAFVMRTLNDPRSWGADGTMSFDRTAGRADLRVVLASPDTVDRLCAPLRTRGQVSCGRAGRATINFRRWVLATDEFTNRTTYRRYVVNHEVGHLLGHAHERCQGAGRLAPVMQQQTYRVAPCAPNAWPYPSAGR